MKVREYDLTFVGDHKWFVFSVFFCFGFVLQLLLLTTFIFATLFIYLSSHKHPLLHVTNCVRVLFTRTHISYGKVLHKS